jgi:NAD(P)-dependent dehydrogenase (short-subunit alcohol dehydrogenase family)
MSAGMSAPYSSAKAALHLARCLAEEGGPHRIRVNTVDPNVVPQDSKTRGSSRTEERARAYSIELEGHEEHYKKRTFLKANVCPVSTAEATLFLTSKTYSSKSTGKIMNVDGGVKDPYAR